MFAFVIYSAVIRVMILTVTEFEKATGVSHNTVYSWIARQKMPKGITLAGIGKSKILKVSKISDYYEMVQTELAK